MEVKTKPIEIWAEYQKGVQYLSSKDIFQKVQRNENFYIGDQWGDLKIDNMPMPVINVLQRVVKYLIATLSTNDVSIAMTPFTTVEEDIALMQPIEEELKHIIEIAKIKEQARTVIRNAAVDGSSFLFQIFNERADSGQDVKGRIESKVVDNTQVFFGNPYSNVIQDQPFIIIALRQHLSQVKAEAEMLGVKKQDIEKITADNDQLQANDDSNELVTVLLKFYKQRRKEINEREEIDLEGNIVVIKEEQDVETVFFTKTTKEVTLIKPVDLGYKRYPLACFGWDAIKNSYLYESPLTAVIPNQIFINKCYSIAMQYGQQSAFPKIVYDKNKIDIRNFLENTSPTATANIDMMGKFMDFIKVPDFSNNILALIQDIMQQTKECMGVNDASLGNVNPDNTSAIVALQEATNVPLEIQHQQYFEMWEDIVRNIIDIVANTYGTRRVMTSDNQLMQIDFSILKDINYNLNVDIGNGSQYSEVAQINTMDKLLQTGIVDPKTYIESIPSKYIINKAKILKVMTEREQQQQEMMAQQMAMPQM